MEGLVGPGPSRTPDIVLVRACTQCNSKEKRPQRLIAARSIRRVPKKISPANAFRSRLAEIKSIRYGSLASLHSRKHAHHFLAGVAHGSVKGMTSMLKLSSSSSDHGIRPHWHSRTVRGGSGRESRRWGVGHCSLAGADFGHAPDTTTTQPRVLITVSPAVNGALDQSSLLAEYRVQLGQCPTDGIAFGLIV